MSLSAVEPPGPPGAPAITSGAVSSTEISSPVAESAISSLPAPLASAVSAQALAGSFRTRQIALSRATVRDLVALWRSKMGTEDANAAWAELRPLVSTLITTRNAASAADAATYYNQSRAIAGIGPLVIPSPRIPAAYMDKVIDPMAMGTYWNHIGQGSAEASDAASKALSGAGQRLTMKGGRDVIQSTAARDPEAKGWARIADPGACDFCQVLSGRGAVYKERTVDFRAHDHCSCTAKVELKGYTPEMTDAARRWLKARGYTYP